MLDINDLKIISAIIIIILRSDCKFPIYSSFEMCMYYYLNDIHLCYNKNVSENFVKNIWMILIIIFLKNISDLLHINYSKKESECINNKNEDELLSMQ